MNTGRVLLSHRHGRQILASPKRTSIVSLSTIKAYKSIAHPFLINRFGDLKHHGIRTPTRRIILREVRYPVYRSALDAVWISSKQLM